MSRIESASSELCETPKRSAFRNPRGRGLGSADPRGEELDRILLPGGRVDDALTVRGEASAPDVPAPESHPPKQWSGAGGWLPQEVPDNQAARQDRDREESFRKPCGTAPRRRNGARSRGGGSGQRLQVEGEVVGGVEALFGVLLEAVAHDPLEAGGDVLVGDGEIRRVLLEDRRHRVRGRVAVERALAREHLVEDRAEGEDVAAGVGGPAAHLLGRHVAERAQHDARLRAGGGGRKVGRLGALFLVRQLGEAEVEDLDAAVLRDEEVLGLQVPVDDALLVRGRQAVGDLEGVVHGLARRELAARQSAARSVSPSSSSGTT